MHEEQNYRLVDLQQIQNLTNPKNLKEGEIAITIITPEGTIHAIPSSPELLSHCELVNPIYSDIFGDIEEKPGSYCIEIRHAIYGFDNHIAYPFIPKVITPLEYEELRTTIEILLKNGCKLTSTITTFDPRILNSNVPKLFREYNGDQILEYLDKEMLIEDYYLPFEYKGNLKPIKQKEYIL